MIHFVVCSLVRIREYIQEYETGKQHYKSIYSHISHHKIISWTKSDWASFAGLTSCFCWVAAYDADIFVVIAAALPRRRGHWTHIKVMFIPVAFHLGVVDWCARHIRPELLCHIDSHTLTADQKNTHKECFYSTRAFFNYITGRQSVNICHPVEAN